ncbi:hypothetical protein CCR78_12390 [Rhodovulum imhoffii]|nr:hypothetical protein [Rhodovulum imhoffii]
MGATLADVGALGILHSRSVGFFQHSRSADWLPEGSPKTIRVDNGNEVVSHDLDFRFYADGGTLGFSRSGNPTDSGIIMSDVSANGTE